MMPTDTAPAVGTYLRSTRSCANRDLARPHRAPDWLIPGTPALGTRASRANHRPLRARQSHAMAQDNREGHRIGTLNWLAHASSERVARYHARAANEMTTGEIQARHDNVLAGPLAALPVQ